MSRSDEKLCLQWNDFRNNVSSTFKDLRDDKDFTDVTLACEDGQQVEAHKVVLIASSPFFLNLLKRNKHPHPLVYMRGLKFENLLSLVDFLYHGEANVFQDNLDSFLGMAEEFQLKGLDKMEEEPVEQVPKESKRKISQSLNNQIAKDNTPPQGLQGIADAIPITETALAQMFQLKGLHKMEEEPVEQVLQDSEERVWNLLRVPFFSGTSSRQT